MNINPTFSVVVPVYNKKPHLARSINSVLNQTDKDFELIIINDASTDGSQIEIDNFSDSRIRLHHRQQPGPGGYAARNMGISKAGADWVAFLDADDEWTPDHLNQYRKLIKKFPEAGFFSCGWQISEDKVKIINSYAKHNTSEHLLTFQKYLLSCIADRYPVCTSVACMRRSLAKGIFPEGRAARGGDHYAYLQMMSKTNMAWSPHIGAVYHRNAVNMVTKSAPGTLTLFQDLVYELNSHLDIYTLNLLKKQCNRMMWTIFKASVFVTNQKVDLGSHLFWHNDLVFCTTKTLLAKMPECFLKAMKRLKKVLK